MSEIAETGAQQIAELLVDAVMVRKVAHLVLAGGRAAVPVIHALAEHSEVPWSKTHLWWGDERLVPASDPDRNDGQVESALAKMTGAHVHRMPTSAAQEPAAAYQAELRAHLANNSFDVVMLGIGEDGHVASLFPGRYDPDDPAEVREVSDSPKPPARRLTLTLSRLNNTRHLFLIASGPQKRSAIASARLQDPSVPVGRVRGIESTTFIVDLDGAP